MSIEETENELSESLKKTMEIKRLTNELEATKKLLLEATQNLGHPAYGQSTATTIHIDELREKCFDFLSVPK